jgi:bifunctional non-homologous end joining protein LigD
MSLSDYHAKRKFDETPEPQGGQGSGPLRFVVQKHDASRLHYDFRLEMNGILKSWAIPKGPSLNPEDKRLAMMTEDHPYDYRTFEGNIPKGNYGAGSVIVWDEGTYEPLAWDEKTGKTLELTREQQDKLAREGVHKGHLTFILHGHKLRGEFALIKLHHAEDNAWLLVKAHKDEFVSEADVTQHAESVITGRTVEEVAAGAPETQLHLDLTGAPAAPLPTAVKPMLATLAKDPFDNPDWLYEIKWDGYRILAHITADEVRLITRGDQDYTTRFQPAAAELHTLRVPAIIDGEICVVDAAGKPSFQALQNYLRDGESADGQLMYYAFDLLHLDGHNLTGLPLSRRKELLRRILPQGAHLKYSDHVAGQGIALLESARAQGLEGVMAKAAASTYQPGRRSRDWLKFKTHHRQEAVIVGYTEPRGGRQYFGALVLGVYDANGQLQYVGHTGGGFTESTLRSTYDLLQPLRQDASPITPEPKTNEPAHWVKPQLVCEVEFTEWTGDGSMRHPIFVGLRDDKPATQVRKEEAVKGESAKMKSYENEQTGGAKRELPRQEDAAQQSDPDKITTPRSASRGVIPAQPKQEDWALPSKGDATVDVAGHNLKFTHLDKIFWPDDHLTKGQLLDYYHTVAGTMLPYLKDRPQSLHRFPNGITGSSFYQKDMADQPPEWTDTIVIHSDSENRDLNYLICQDLPTLLYMINLGCIELNPWNSRTSALENPDWCVIDLDPEDIGFDAVIRTAQAVHTVLDELGLPSYPKTSGATGIHIYIPTGAKYNYDQVKMFGQLIAQLVHTRVPDITSLERSPAKRQGKVYLDYLQNRHGQTLAAAYSVRPKPGATVSIPLDWSEVADGLTPAQFTIHNAHERLSNDADLWRPVIGPGIDLAAVLKSLS